MISFLQYRYVVRDVAGNDVGQGADTHGVAAGDAGAAPGFLGQVAEERQGGGADGAEIRDVAGPGKLIGGCVRDGDILIETRQRRVEPAREPQGSVEEYALGIADVVQELANGPFIGRVAVERLLLGDSREDAAERYRAAIRGRPTTSSLAMRSM